MDSWSVQIKVEDQVHQLQISLHIRIVWSAPLLFAPWIV